MPTFVVDTSSQLFTRPRDTDVSIITAEDLRYAAETWTRNAGGKRFSPSTTSKRERRRILFGHPFIRVDSTWWRVTA